jgi:iron complex transport system substrate-binding protein
VHDDAGVNASPQAAPRRIVSMAPSVTEILFALGAGDRVVGVTRYCDYPPEAVDRTKVGGYDDPNYEAILSLEPDLLILLPEHRDSRPKLTKLRLKMLVVDHTDIPGILKSIGTIGAACGMAEKAQGIVKDIRTRMDEIERRTRGLDRPSVLVSVGRNMGTGTVDDVFVSGKEGFFDALITMAGGANAYAGPDIRFPKLSAEGILELDPDVIVDMVPDAKDEDLEKIRDEWRKLKEAKAVKQDRVHIMNKGYSVIPGPRFVLLLEDLAEAVHPELEWGRK